VAGHAFDRGGVEQVGAVLEAEAEPAIDLCAVEQQVERDQTDWWASRFEPAADALELDLAVDEIRARFGLGAITRAVLLGRETGFTMPLLPDS
jgi:hypothetical protein